MSVQMGESGSEGRRLSHYLVLDRIGAGGMGEVYRAEDVNLGRLVALKLLPQSLTAAPGSGSNADLGRAEALARFRREARSVAALNHPGICTIFEIDEHEGQPFIAMELLDGMTLRERLAKVAPEPMPVSQVLDLGVQIADALDAAHQQGVIHRDLKPANLFVTSRDRAKILDFGLAKRKPIAREKAAMGSPVAEDEISVSWGPEGSYTTPLGEYNLTNPGSLVGTIAYMSPEQALGEPLDERTDIFSLGAVLYEVATGRRAFQGPTALAVSNAIINHDPPLASEINSQVPPGLADVIQRCLAKKPEDRYQTAIALRADLQSLRGDPSSASISTSTRKQTVLDTARTRRRIWLTTPGVVLAAVLLALIVPASRGWLFTQAGNILKSSRQPALPSPISLVVLPFTGAPSDAGLTAFGNGLADALTARLVQLTPGRSFQVTPASELRAKEITTLDQARRDFGANLGLVIGLERAEGIVRVSYTVVDAKSGRALRGDSIPVAESDLVSAEDRLVESAARSLDLGLRSEEKRGQSFRGTRSSAAYEYYLQGTGYLPEGSDPAKLASALETLQEALKLDPQFGLAEAALGEASWKKYEVTQDRPLVESARAACRHAIELGNAGAEGHLCLGTLASGTGDYAQAVTQFQLAVQLDPTSDRAYSSLAVAYSNLNQFGEAEKTYQREIDLRPQYWRGYNMLGVFYFTRQDYQKARTMFQKVVELAPDSYRGYSNLGGADVALDNMEGAVQELEHSIAIQPSENAYSNLGTAYFLLGNYREAARNFVEATKLNPMEYDYWGFLGDAQYYGGQRPQAMDAYRTAVKLGEDALKVNPNDAGILGLVSGYHSMLGDKQQALAELDRALASGQPDKDLLFNATLIYNQLGEKAVAIEWLSRALAAGYSPYVLAHSPSLNNLHNDPRYKQLLRQK
ncbi:MAG TPA: tetratricopeptide repeat protein [Terriglobia bacterium]|nr:tetratricopeptide repeat protein [Terriglobia bacterium]